MSIRNFQDTFSKQISNKMKGGGRVVSYVSAKVTLVTIWKKIRFWKKSKNPTIMVMIFRHLTILYQILYCHK